MKFYLSLLTLLCAIFVQGQTTLSASCTEDTYVQNGSATNNSAATTLNIDINPSVRRAYLKFDIAALNIPYNAVVTAAQIRLRVNAESGVSSTSFVVQRATSAWSESTVTFASQPTVETTDQTNSSSVASSYRSFSVLPQVQKMILNPASDLGFCIRWAVESSATSACSYMSKNHGTAAYRPVLQITYYVPYSVTAAIISEASTTSASDGSVVPTISGGPSGSKLYQWYNGSGAAISGATNANLTGATYGWYGLKVTNSTGGDVMYMGFLVGVRCEEVSITYNPGPDYVDDVVYSLAGLFATPVFTSNSATNNATYSYAGHTGTREGTLMKFRLWIDPELTISQADMTMYGSAHSGTANTSSLYRLTQTFDEVPLYYGLYLFPTNTSTGLVTIPHQSGSANAVLDIKHFWTEWKNNNLANYGMQFVSNTVSGTVNQAQTYYSSDALAAVRPSIQFKVNLPCQYYYLKDEVEETVAYMPYNGFLRFRFRESYFDVSGTLSYKIKNLQTDALSTGTLSSSKHFNWMEINTGSLSLAANTTYLLEVSDEKGNRQYLKFKTGPCTGC